MSAQQDEFVRYYADESVSAETLERFAGIKATVSRMLAASGRADEKLTVADIGCGAGSQSIMWARDGHRVYGIDINEPLIELAVRRAAEERIDITFDVGSADALPWADRSVDVCLVPELLEHVAAWRTCLDEFARIVKPNGVLFLSTNNVLCPKQEEFDLPFYSWYPGWLKRRYERLAVTTRPELVNHARYPAVNWFNFYGLRAEFEKRGMRSLDRFDLMDVERLRPPLGAVLRLVRAVPPLRWLGHVFTPYTAIIGIKE